MDRPIGFMYGCQQVIGSMCLWLERSRNFRSRQVRVNGHNGQNCEWSVIQMAENKSTLTGLTDDEAKEFQYFFSASMNTFIGIAFFAHILAWAWRPWL